MTSVEPNRCKLEINVAIIQKIMKVNYMGLELSAFGTIEGEIQTTGWSSQ